MRLRYGNNFENTINDFRLDTISKILFLLNIVRLSAIEIKIYDTDTIESIPEDLIPLLVKDSLYTNIKLMYSLKANFTLVSNINYKINQNTSPSVKRLAKRRQSTVEEVMIKSE